MREQQFSILRGGGLDRIITLWPVCKNSLHPAVTPQARQPQTFDHKKRDIHSVAAVELNLSWHRQLQKPKVTRAPPCGPSAALSGQTVRLYANVIVNPPIHEKDQHLAYVKISGFRNCIPTPCIDS